MRESSRDAFESIKPHRESHYSIIKRALNKIGKPAYSKQISEVCILDYHEVARRLNEMEKKEEVKVVGRAFNIKNRPLLWELISK